jgi:pentatricopeptide repeat protein
MVLFNSAISQGIANSHTYAAALNANIRCGSLEGAEKVMAEMSANGRRKDVVICTTLIKGYCGDGRLSKALMLLEEMGNSKPVIVPNVRTINTILRGCVQAGDIDNADIVLNKAIKDHKITLDVSSWEYMVILFCQGLRLDKVLPIVGRLKSDPTMASGMVNMHVNMARAAALLGEWKTCRKALVAASAALESSDDTDRIPTVDAAESENTKKSVTGGKRAWKSGPGAGQREEQGGGDEHDQRRLQSLELFQQHSREEMRSEVGAIEEFVTRMSQKATQASPFSHLYPFFLRIFSFSSDAEHDDRSALLSATLHHLEKTFGLGEFAGRLTNQPFTRLIGMAETVIAAPTNLSKKTKAKDAAAAALPVSAASTEVQAVMKGLKEELMKRIDEQGRLDFDSVFSDPLDGAQSIDGESKVTQGPLKMEICSGAGEWAVAQVI